MKFKVGDKVRVIGNSGYAKHYYNIGRICEVKKCFDSCGVCEVLGYGKELSQYISVCDLELVKDDTQVKHHAQKVYKVYEEMKRHVGIENSISATDLCIACGVSSHRELREIMREMRRSGKLEKIPCSCNKGYYMASTKEEAMSAIDRLINTAKNEFKTGYIMMKKLGLDKQMKIPLGEYFKDTYPSLMEIDDEANTETD